MKRLHLVCIALLLAPAAGFAADEPLVCLDSLASEACQAQLQPAAEADVPEKAGFRVNEAPVQQNTEAVLPDTSFTLWTMDENGFTPGTEDRIVFQRRVLEDVVRTELDDVVPVIRSESGMPYRPDDALQSVRDVLEEMEAYQKLRLHFIGHNDNAPLSEMERKRHGNATALSAARAAAAAKFFQSELKLPAGVVTYEGKGASDPIATNATSDGRALNRRVEVRIWYEETSERAIDEEIVIPPPGAKRVKVCRQQPACIIVRKVAGTRKIQLKNVIDPIRFAPGSAEVPAESIEQLRRALERNADKPNLRLRLTGHVDSTPIGTQAARLHGDKKGLSRAQARLVAGQLRRALNLPSYIVSYDGVGDTQPVASNNTEPGRALNRRVEVELWHDAPDGILSVSGLQACPLGGDDWEFISQPFRPNDQDPIAPVPIRDGEPVITERFLQELRALLDKFADKRNLRANFVGYTDPELLSRRGALVYGDNWGLSEARARRVMETVQRALNLPDDAVSFEGGGIGNMVGAQQGSGPSLDGYVAVEVVFDVPAPREGDDVIEVIRVMRDTEPVSPYDLAPMRITVDGKPIDESMPHVADMQRCTDVALDKSNVRFNYDNHRTDPRLNVIAWPPTVALEDDPFTPQLENRLVFRGYANYAAFFDKAEVRIFAQEQSPQDEPAYVIPLDKDLSAEWQADPDTAPALKYVLRVYDEQGRFDETAPKRIWVVHQSQAVNAYGGDLPAQEIQRGYGENSLARHNIPVYGGTITVNGEAIPEGHRVWVMDTRVPVDPEGRFVTQQIIPKGMHTAEVAVLDNQGNGQLFLRDLNFKSSDWFYVGFANVTVGRDNTDGPAELVTQDEDHYDNDVFADGQLAFYVKGKTKNDFELTASADTQEESLGDLFSNFNDKNPSALFRRLDADYYYPTFGDDSETVEDAPTQGKFYVKLNKDKSFGMWGNFEVELLDTDLAHIDRGLYGAYGHFESVGTTSFGESRTQIDAFGAEPGTLSSRDEFRGTGGSLYYLRHQDITRGSERTWVEVRDKDSGIVLHTNNLAAGQDYDIDSIQGRIQLMAPLPSTADDSQLVQAGSLNGHPVYLVTRYEYTPGFTALEDIAVGGRIAHWFGDTVKLGVTASDQDQEGEEQTLSGVDLTLRKSAGTYLKIEGGRTEGPGADELNSNDGGYGFTPTEQNADEETRADATRIEGAIELDEFFEKTRGKLIFYAQQRDAGYSAPGQLTNVDTTQFGGSLAMPVGKDTDLRVKFDVVDEDLGLNTEATNVDLEHQLNKHWRMTTGVRHDTREDNSVTIPDTQTVGERTDAAVQLAYDSHNDWTTYGFAQTTLKNTESREDNDRLGVGGSYQVNNRLKLDAEASGGDLGTGVKLGSDYLLSDNTNLYLSYSLDNERTSSGILERSGNFTSGFRSRYTDSVSVYGEERYAHGDVPTGLTHAYGVDFTPGADWRIGVSAEVGTLQDNKTGAQTDRTAVGFTGGVSARTVKYSGAVEYRKDETDISDRETYLLKNDLKYETSPNWRVLAKLNLSQSDDSQGEFFDGEYVEGVLGYAFRPVDNDRWNTLLKYTYFYNLPSPDQVSTAGESADFIQRSHIFAVDTMYDLTRQWTLGAKYAYRLGELSAEREDPEFFESRAHLLVLRADWHVVRNWDLLLEGRTLDLVDAEDTQSGLLFGVYRHVGNHLKLGVGYNFTDFSDDLTDLDYDSRGAFINLIGKF